MPLQGKRVLCVAYGGGHMRMLIPVAEELKARGAKPVLLPLNVAIKDARASVLPVETLAEALAPDPEKERFLELGRSIVDGSGHPAISDCETFLYHGMGLADLIEELGEEVARARFAERGRKAFHPVRTWRRILKRLAPDLLLATTAPRSEAAALEAAHDLAIPSICVTDHFLVYEVDYVSRPGHGDRVTVLGAGIADYLAEHGRPRSEIRVTGNPAFDLVALACHKQAGKAFRAAQGWEKARVILWPQDTGSVQVTGKPLIPQRDMAAALRACLDADPDLRLIVRPHPNSPSAGFDGEDPRAVVVPDAPVEALVHACDIVVQQCTSVGIQAALSGKRVITVGNAGMPPFAEYGLATDIPDLAGLQAALAQTAMPDISRLGAPEIGSARGLIADAAQELLR